MKYFKGKYRIESARLKEWDYSNPGWYYVTVNTKNHIAWFGRVVNAEMKLNELGVVTNKFWLEIPIHFADVELDYFVIMPNHIHGIIIINPVETPSVVKTPADVETPYIASPHNPLLGEAIGKFKAAVKRWANKNNYKDFIWQARFYDRIIRNEKELFNVRRYISQNPLK